MSRDLITKAVADQISKITGEVTATLVKSATVTLVKEGCNSDVLDGLAAVASGLIPRAQYVDALLSITPLEGSSTSPFFANLLSSQTLEPNSVTTDLQDVWIVAFLHALDGAPRSALELCTRYLDVFIIPPSKIYEMINRIFDVIPAYDDAAASTYRP